MHLLDIIGNNVIPVYRVGVGVYFRGIFFIHSVQTDIFRTVPFEKLMQTQGPGKTGPVVNNIEIGADFVVFCLNRKGGFDHIVDIVGVVIIPVVVDKFHIDLGRDPVEG